MAIYTTDALDITAMYMLMLLYRQLVFSEGSGEEKRKGRNIVEAELTRLKAEIWAVAPPRLGYCFSPNWRKPSGEAVSPVDSATPDEQTSKAGEKEDKEFGKWYEGVKNAALHVVARAKDSKWRAVAAASPNTTSKFCTLSAPPASSAPHLVLQPTPAPDNQMLHLVENWCDTNLQHGSPLSTLLRNRLRETMLQMVVGCYHTVNNLPPLSKETAAAIVLPERAGGAFGESLGMESLMPEMKQIAERIAKLAKIHADAYAAVYEQEGFLGAVEK